MTSTRFDLPSPCGSTTVPRTIWSACFGSTPRRMDRATVSSNFANLIFWTSGSASSSAYGAVFDLLSRRRIFLAVLLHTVPRWCFVGAFGASHRDFAVSFQFPVTSSKRALSATFSNSPFELTTGNW